VLLDQLYIMLFKAIQVIDLYFFWHFMCLKNVICIHVIKRTAVVLIVVADIQCKHHKRYS